MQQAVAVNPNFSGPVRGGQILLARDVLLEQFSNHGLITPEVEEHLAANWETGNRMACMRSWEERAYRGLPDEEGNPADPAVVQGYYDRAARFETAAPAPKSIDMDPEIARERIEHMMRAANPAVHAAQINELRTQVLGEPAIEFADDYIPPPVVTDDPSAPAAKKIAKAIVADHKAAKRALFLNMVYLDQKAAIGSEKDTEFLGWVRTQKVIPAVRLAAKKRLAEIGAGE